MNEQFEKTAKQIGDALIDISDLLSANMELWSDVPTRPNGLGTTECAGFIMKDDAGDGLNLVLDIQAPANLLRIWAIEREQDGDNELFNNVQLDFAMDPQTAQKYAQKAAAITRDDIRAALHEPATHLTHVVISSKSGIDKISQQPVGKRYELTADQTEAADAEIGSVMQGVLAALTDAMAEDSPQK